MYYSQLIVLLPLISLTIAYPKHQYTSIAHDAPVHACGEYLDLLVDLACNEKKQLMKGKHKRSSDDLWGYEYEENYREESPENDRPNRFPYFPNESPNMFAPVNTKSKKGIVETCCKNACTKKYIMANFC